MGPAAIVDTERNLRLIEFDLHDITGSKTPDARALPVARARKRFRPGGVIVEEGHLVAAIIYTPFAAEPPDKAYGRGPPKDASPRESWALDAHGKAVLHLDNTEPPHCAVLGRGHRKAEAGGRVKVHAIQNSP